MSATKKVIPIAARDRGPGPGRYGLPSTCGYKHHDYTKNMKPAYLFGCRIGDAMYKTDCSPGPVYFVDPRTTRHGSDGTPSYSMLARQRDQVSFKTPGPGTYRPEVVHPQGERHAPNYSMSQRTRVRRHDKNPAPSRYLLPQLLGSNQPNRLSAPSYSMTNRTNVGSYSEDLSKTPGPGRYNAIETNVICDKRPQYSMQARSYMPGDNTLKPGPGAHKPEQVHINKPQPPQFSLGIRHSEFVTPLLIDI